MIIIIKNLSRIPIYEQIKEQVKEAILNNEINEGDVLPSIAGYIMGFVRQNGA